MRRLTLTLTAVLLLAGCGQPAAEVATAQTSGPASASAPPSDAADPEARLRQYAQCLRDHGLTVADPAPGSGVRIDPGQPPERVDVGVKACMSYAAAAEAPRPPSAADLDHARRYAQCMRGHGVPAFPDPDPQTGFFSGLTKSNYDTGRPEVQAALKACQGLQPAVQPGG